MIDPKRKTMPGEGGAISYLEWAGEGPVLHFAHANGFNAQTYTTLLGPLAERFHIYASDLRGHGLTTLPTPPGFTKGWTLLRDDMIGFLEAVAAGPILLAGHSVGAIVSLMAAAARPDLVRALVLIEPVFVPESTPPESMAANELAARAAKRRDVFDSVEAMEEAYRGRGAFRNWSNAMLHDYIVGGTAPTEDGRIRLTCTPAIESEAFSNTPIGAYRLAREIRCPVTLMCGTGPGSTCHAPEAEAFVSNKPDTRLIVQDGASHFLPMEYPALVRDEILRAAGAA